MRILALLVAATLPLVGCLDGDANRKEYKDRTITAVLDSGIAPSNRTGDLFYVAWISGAEHVDHIAGKGVPPERQCAPYIGVEYDSAESVIRYDPAAQPVDTENLQILVVLEYRGDAVYPDALGRDCATQALLMGYDGRASFTHEMRDDLTIEIVAEPQNGFFTYNRGYFIPMGKKIHVNLTRVEKVEGGHSFYVTGDFEVVNLGLWTREQLVARS